MSRSPYAVVRFHVCAVRSIAASSGNGTPSLSPALRRRARNSRKASARRVRFALSVAGVTSMSSVTTGAPAMRAAAAPIRTNRTPWRSSAPRILSGSGSGTARRAGQRAELPAGRHTAPKTLRRRSVQLTFDKDLVVVAGINRGEPHHDLETGRSYQGPQSLQARSDLIAFVAADQGGRHPAAPAELCLRYTRPTPGFDQ